jgi:flagellar hook-associated protein 2
LGSPITFSGFNSIDFNMVLESVMTQERVPLNRLETQKTTLQSQHTAFGTLAGKLGSLQTAVESLTKPSSLAFLSATSTDAGVGVTSTAGTVTGTYDIVVSELARAQVTSSLSTFASLSTVVGTGGTMTLTPADGSAATTITLTGSTTLEQLAAKINAVADAPASASVVQTSPGVYSLVLSGRDTGTTSAFTVAAAVTGGPGVTFKDFDGDGQSGDSLSDNSQQAINAAFTVNGLLVSSASNTVSDVIAGATLSLSRKDPATTVTVKVERDNTQSKNLLTKFINAYNDLQTFAKDQATAATAGRPSIAKDPLLKSLRDALRRASMEEYTGGTLTRLAEIGVGFDQTGKMILDGDVFDDAMAASPTAVQTLVSGAAGDSGAFGAFGTLLETYTDSGGLVATMRERLDAQVNSISRRLDTMQSTLALRRAALQKEYIAADLAMTRLKSQSASLSSVGGGYKLF